MKFESFLRPGGGSSSETLAGRISLDAYDRRFSMSETTVPPPSGAETRIPEGSSPSQGSSFSRMRTTLAIDGRHTFDG